METYKTKVVCSNCKEPQEINVPKGTLVLEYLRKKAIICNNCEYRLKQQISKGL